MKLVLGAYDYPPNKYHLNYIDQSWTFTDINPRHPAIRAVDAREIPYKNVERIYASHVLEHIPEHEVLRTLKHWRNVLQKDGDVHINVPDIQWFLDNWMRINCGKKTQSFFYDNKNVLLKILDGDGSTVYDTHKSWFNVDKLEKYMKDAGFKKVKVYRIFEAHDMGCVIGLGRK